MTTQTAQRNRELQVIRERAQRQRERDTEQQRYYAILSAWASETHARMFRDYNPLFAYVIPSTATEYGRLVACSELDTVPEGAERIDPEPLTRNCTPNTLLRWITEKSARLPMYPTR